MAQTKPLSVARISSHPLLRLPVSKRPLTVSFSASHLLRSGTSQQVRSYNIVRPAYAACNIPEFPTKSYNDLKRYALKNPSEFWSVLARSRLLWRKDFDVASECNFPRGKIEWFTGGKLNVCENALDRHAAVDPDRIALLWERDNIEEGHETMTYKQLLQLTSKIANGLKNKLNVKKGDRVCIYLPNSPVAVACMLACARIGAVHSVIFAGFSANSIATRATDAEAAVIITANEAMRGGKFIPLKKTVEEALKTCPSIRNTVVYRRTDSPYNDKPGDIDFEKFIAGESEECEPEILDAEDPLFILYTSGSTGKPKGLLHTQAGYALYCAVTHKHVFGYENGEVHGCLADIGWITGHSYIMYGPLLNGATTVLFESTPTYPNPGRYWRTVEKLGINHLYLAPTALRTLLKFGDEWPNKYDLSSLRTLGVVGEPINHEAWRWYNEVVGKKRCPIIDTWWQTETGGICIAPTPKMPNSPIEPAMPMRPFFGIEPVILDDKVSDVADDHKEQTEPHTPSPPRELKPTGGKKVEGALAISKPWPGMARTIYGNHSHFIKTYFAQYPGYYQTGDTAELNSDGYFKISGRNDDVINISGHRLGTAEVEDALANHKELAEVAVVGYPHKKKGEGIFAFCVTRSETSGGADEGLKKSLREAVKTDIASYAQPDIILTCNGLPRTRSGKIMRRVLRKIAAEKYDKDELGDLSTLADPSVVDDIIKLAKNVKRD